jgi:hypothetical protein
MGEQRDRPQIPMAETLIINRFTGSLSLFGCGGYLLPS